MEPVELLVPTECFLDAVEPEPVDQQVLPALPPAPGPNSSAAVRLVYEQALRAQAQTAASVFRQERDALQRSHETNAPVQNTCARFMRGQNQ